MLNYIIVFKNDAILGKYCELKFFSDPQGKFQGELMIFIMKKIIINLKY